MADFDLTQTDAQVQSILNDAQDAQGAGAQTTLTTDYIMLKGTNGRYHKILKDSFTEAVRNVLAGLLVNNDKGTTISQIAAIASGDFGSITPANLASVLGGTNTPIPENSDVYEVLKTGGFGCYTSNNGSITSSLTNAPSTITSSFTILAFPGNAVGTVKQYLAIGQNGNDLKIEVNRFISSYNTWVGWKSVNVLS